MHWACTIDFGFSAFLLRVGTSDDYAKHGATMLGRDYCVLEIGEDGGGFKNSMEIRQMLAKPAVEQLALIKLKYQCIPTDTRNDALKNYIHTHISTIPKGYIF